MHIRKINIALREAMADASLARVMAADHELITKSCLDCLRVWASTTTYTAQLERRKIVIEKSVMQNYSMAFDLRTYGCGV